MRLKGKAAIVTGGTKGIGAALVERLAAEGAQVCFSYLASERRAEAIRQSLADRGLEVIGLQADVRNRAAVESLVGEAANRFGGVDIVVNNAHAAYEGKPFEAATLEDFQREFDTLVKGPINTVQAALPHFKARGGGAVVNVGSSMAETPRPNHSFYVTAKCALIGLTRSMAIELGGYGVRVNMVTPGPLDTEHNATYPPEVMARLGRETPLGGRLATCEEVADAIVMLVTNDSRCVTGANVLASGGFSIA